MLKHIIVLALYLMAYIIGNIDAEHEQHRLNQFNKFIHCYENMFVNEIIKGNKVSQDANSSGGAVAFQDILRALYVKKEYSFNPVRGKYLLPLDSDHFKNNQKLNYLKELITLEFKQISDEELTKKMNELAPKTQYNDSSLLTPFIFYFAANSKEVSFEAPCTLYISK
ncbi:uncharacterized protein LOC100166702 isoform b precursor [Acyrthosiphon pisum]|uniref:ACYPI007553 protein n=1 Tax=Acyrthosiphon pisum TaxID=7029 RepID=C4WXF2_ACYPI|nr:uncharacterized protein LOC100166702 isoform b precursor [Acyrthosiphon pisum]BAH72572.1 ACYPI007553 [Acyrthosiphon pisum]|eukprot:NP_001155718.1 uncharacterized protein LOC100166702 isoform b precursor [Acyrthosiphon pisum]